MALSAADFRKELKFRASRLEDIVGMLPNGKPVTATVKVDGELEVWEADVPAGVFRMFNRNENQRHVAAIGQEILAALQRAGHQSARGAGELYTVQAGARGRPSTRPASFEQSISQIKTRTKADTPAADQRFLRLALFDLFALDGQPLWGQVDYADRFALLYAIFTDGEHLVRPVIGQTLKPGEHDVIDTLWKKHVLEANFEGLVIRTNGAVKVKPIHTLDLAVIGVQEGTGRHRGRMGALLIAYRDWNGRYVLASKVGTGFTDLERTWWWETLARTASTVKVGTTTVRLVVPQFVVEVEAERFIHRKAPAWHWHERTGRWVRVATQPSAILQKPRFVRRRADKDLSPYDLRLDQVPGWGSDVAQATIPSPATNGATFGKLLGRTRPDLARFASKLRVPAGDFEDLLQETYLKALTAWQKLHQAGRFVAGRGMPEPGKPLVTWLFTIFANQWTSLQRKRAVRAKRATARGARQAAQLAELRARGRELEATQANPKVRVKHRDHWMWVDRRQLELGTREELEHTDNVEIAKQIALDHLHEIPDYYTRLRAMERQATRRRPAKRRRRRKVRT